MKRPAPSKLFANTDLTATVRQQTVNRSILYAVLAPLLIGFYIVISASSWSGSRELYTLFEFASTVLALIVSAMALIKYFTRRNPKYLFIGIGFLAVSLLDGYRTVINGVLITPHILSPTLFLLLLYSWTVSRFVLALFFSASIVTWFVENRGTAISRSAYYLIIFFLLAFVAVIFIIIPPSAIRLLDSVTTILFLITLIGFIYKRFWTFKYFEHWFTMSLMIGLLAQFLYGSSMQLYDAYFVTAHIAKTISYSFALVGLLMSMYIAFNEVTESKDKINAILKSIGDGVFAVDRNGSVLLMNSVSEQLSGYTSGEAIGKPYTHIFHFKSEEHPKVPYPDFVKEVITKGHIVSLKQHTILVRKDGKEISVSDSAAPIHDEAGTTVGCIIVIRDVTKEREFEQTKDDFLSVASHQLRTPLGSMRWNMEMLLSEEMGKLPKDAKFVVSQMYESMQRLVNLVNDLLSVSRIDQRRVANRPKSTIIASVVENVVAELNAEAIKRKAIITIETKGAIPEIVIDNSRLHEVLLNLVSNALKYNRANGTVTITLSIEKEHVAITIADTGIGIPEKEQNRLFSKFFRATNATNSATDGSGLGLFVVQSYVESWGGTVSFVSHEGRGTAFTIRIPVKPKNTALDENLAEKPHTVA